MRGLMSADRDREGAGSEGSLAPDNAKDEQIELLKSVLVQLSDELKKKDERIAELETQLFGELTNGNAMTTTSTAPPTCPRRSGGQSSTLASSPMATRTQSTSSDRFAHNLSPIKESPPEVCRRNSDNKATPRRTLALDQEQQGLQQVIATLDTAIAELELQTTSEHRLAALRRERAQMMAELNSKVQLRLKMVRQNSDDVFTRLATEYKNCTREQMCDAVRELDRAQVKYKAYIDQLLAVVLETNSALLEGMPRLQQSTGLRMDLLRVASRGELFDDIRERERNVASLESYTTLLAKRIMEHAPPLLPTLDSFHDTTGRMEPDLQAMTS